MREVVDSVLGENASGLGDLVVHTTLDAAAQRAAVRAVADRAAAIERAAGAPLPAARPGPRGRPGGARPEERRDPRARRRTEAHSAGIQPGARRPAPAGLRLQAVRLRRGARGGHQPGHRARRFPRRRKRRPAGVAPGQLRGELRGTAHPPARADALRERGHGPALAADRRSAGRLAGAPGRHPLAARSGSRHRPRRARGDAARAHRGLRRFGNGGLRVTPRLVRTIETPDGTVLWRSPEAQPPNGCSARPRRISSPRCWNRWWTEGPAASCASWA